ncbi:hypothetical protein NE848_15835 [Gramella jeungdoensis]|uniref:Uncharacterized protein n=1 Tax=Gramella jeungdoensis TaxID=708091 RepID=A0ABT0Z6W2_9FLAO|nr:hypothetical protein [Gramella jeungdoensis]MCM8570867.1 hypothetical protein [Gramella jeungdoensis]
MDPLNKILNWINELPLEIQSELVSLTSHFHFDKTIERELDENERLSKFKEYLDSENLDDNEIVQRALFIKKLIDFSMAGRGTEEDWTEVLDRHLDTRSRLKEKGLPTKMNDDFLSTYQERKSKWIELYSNWENISNNELSDKKIADWYFMQIVK